MKVSLKPGNVEQPVLLSCQPIVCQDEFEGWIESRFLSFFLTLYVGIQISQRSVTGLVGRLGICCLVHSAGE